MLGKLITFEGIDGSGKTFLLNELKRRLRSKNNEEIIFTREPGGIKVADGLRRIILDNKIDSKTEVLLYAAARREHILKKILPSLSSGKSVFCDRFVDSSIAYQGFARGLGENVRAINKYVVGDLKPDLTFLLDVDPEISLQRISQNRETTNRFDEEKIDFHNKVRQGYLELAKNEPERFVVIDASKTLSEMVDEVLEELKIRFGDYFEDNLDLSLTEKSQPKKVEKRILYTDGSASPNPGPGGFAVIENGAPIFMGREANSTNIRMEGLALKKALELLNGEEADIWTDSEFWCNVLTKWAPIWQANGWRKKSGEISNLDIVQPLFEFYQKSNIEITRNINNYQVWTDNEIKNRAEQLYEKSKEIWSIPAGYKIQKLNNIEYGKEYLLNSSINVTGEKPDKLIIDSIPYPVKSWKGLLEKLCIELYNLDSDIFKELIYNPNFQTKERVILSNSISKLRQPIEISNDLYIESNLNANAILSYADIIAANFELSDEIYFVLKRK